MAMETDKNVVNFGSKHHKESELFLQNLYTDLHDDAPEVYNLENEFEKLSKHKSHFIFILILSVVAVISACLFITTHIIDERTRDVAININTFNDLNLQNLLNRAARVEASYNSAVIEKAMLESRLDARIAEINMERDGAVARIKSLSLDGAEERRQINGEYTKARVNAEEFRRETVQKIDVINRQIETYKKELEEFDKMHIEAGNAAQAERQRFEIEKADMKARYETVIADLQSRLEEVQKTGMRLQSQNIEAVASEYQQKLDAAGEENEKLTNDILLLKSESAALKARVEAQNEKAAALEKDLSYEKTLGEKYRANYQSTVEKNGFAGLVIDPSDTNRMLLYIDPLYGRNMKGQKAFIYRQNFERVADIVITGENGVYWGRLLRLDTGKTIEANDRVLLNTGGKNETE